MEENTKEKINLIGYLNLKDSKNYQFLYASQNYNTFYGIYGKFEAEKSKEGYLINSITFLLVNYKGVINIGFQYGHSVEINYANENKTPQINKIPTGNLEENIQNEVFDTRDTNQFKINLRGLSENNYLKVNFKNGLKVKDIFSIKRVLKTLTTKRMANGDAYDFNGQVFDSEFFYRDGLGKSRANRNRNGRERIHHDYKEEIKENVGEKLIADDCVESNLKIIYV